MERIERRQAGLFHITVIGGIAIGWFAIGIAHAQTAASARPVGVEPKVDAQGQPFIVKALPKGYSADRPPPAPARPPSVFFNKNGVVFKPEAQSADRRGGLSDEGERKPKMLDKPQQSAIPKS